MVVVVVVLVQPEKEEEAGPAVEKLKVLFAASYFIETILLV